MERSFGQCKSILCSNHPSFILDNLKQHIIVVYTILFNNILNNVDIIRFFFAYFLIKMHILKMYVTYKS